MRALPLRAALAVLALLAVAPARPAAAAPPDARVALGSAASIRIVVDVPELAVVDVQGLEPRREPRLEGYDWKGTPGRTLLPERIVTVAVPPVGDVRLAARGALAETRDDLVLPRGAWTPRPVPGAAPPEAVAPDEETGTVPAPETPVARLLDVSWLRNQRVARIAVAPLAVDAQTRRLTLQRRVEIELAVEGRADFGAAAEPVDPFESVYRELLVNYEQGRAWRRPARASGPAFARLAEPAEVVEGGPGPPTTSVYAGRRWVKIAIPKAGFYKVSFGRVRNTAVFDGDTTTALDSLRLFTWPGVPVLPETSYCDNCDYREVAIGFVENGNGQFSNANDYFYFFAMGPSDWADRYDTTQPDTSFINHPYETRNYVYLTVSRGGLDPVREPGGAVPGLPKRIGFVSGALGDTTGVPVPGTFRERAHFEQDLEFFPDATHYIGGISTFRSTLVWEKWYWRSLLSGQSFGTDLELPGMETSQPARLRLRVWGLSFVTSRSFGVQDHYLDLSFEGIPLRRLGWGGFSSQTVDTVFTGVDANARLDLAVPAASAVEPNGGFAATRFDRTGFAWADVFYDRRFAPVGNELAFDSPPGGGEHIYRIGPFTVGQDSTPHVFDVTDPLEPFEITSLTYTALGAGEWQLRFRAAEAGTRHYRVVSDPVGAAPPTSDVVNAPSSSLENLRDPSRAADYLLVYYDGFRAAADSLLRWRRESLPLQGRAAPYDTFSVPISAIYDQFSGGRTDPTAIRNCLRAIANWSRKPAFVTFLGDASYDFKNITGLAVPGQPGTLLPSYEGGYDPAAGRQYTTDDWLLNVDNPIIVVPDFLGGRIPAPDPTSALIFVRKQLDYERSAPLGEWRNRLMLIADDNEQGSRPDGIGWNHLRQTTEVENEIPQHVDRIYEYLHTFPDGPNDTKPGAKADIAANLNNGVILFNYIGHGSPFKIADETVMTDSDASSLVNGDLLPLFVAASCDVGKFHDPAVLSLGERLVLNPNGGAIGVISATELAFSGENAQLARLLFRKLFERDSTTRRYFRTAAEALLVGKSGGVNNQKYQLMGDAALRLNLPREHVEVTLHDEAGAPVTQLHRGATYLARGRILDGPGGTPVAVSGIAALLIEDSAPIDVVGCLPGSEVGCVPYPFRASAIYRGDVAVNAGQFETRFVVSLDAALGPRGRARAYVDEAGLDMHADGAGSDSFEVQTGAAPSGDEEGPRITLSFPGGSTSVRPDATLRIDLFDPSGILITGKTPQNGIIVTIDGNSSLRQEVTASFRYAANSYQSGTATFRLPGLAAGSHTIRVSAADNLALGITAAQHRSAATITFEVMDNPSLSVTRAFLMPTPTSSKGPRAGGQFVIDAPGDSVNVMLRIYTVSGRLIRTLKAYGGLGQTQLPWDGRDDEGFPIANGVYLFRVHVNPRETDGTSSARQKAVAEGRFAIVNR